MNLTSTLESMIAGKPVDRQRLLAMARHQDTLLQEAHQLLGKCEKQVGLALGEEIAVFDAKITGKRFNEKEFHYDQSPDGQE